MATGRSVRPEVGPSPDRVTMPAGTNAPLPGERVPMPDHDHDANYRRLQTDEAQETYQHALTAMRAENARKIAEFTAGIDAAIAQQPTHYHTQEQPVVQLGHCATADAQRAADDAAGGLLALACHRPAPTAQDAARDLGATLACNPPTRSGPQAGNIDAAHLAQRLTEHNARAAAFWKNLYWKSM